MRVAVLAGTEHRGAGDEGVGPGAGDGGDVVGLHPAVDLEQDAAAGARLVGVELRTRGAQLVQGLGDELLPAEAARAAGMPVLLVTYGYSEGVPVDSIECDGLLSSLVEMLPHIGP